MLLKSIILSVLVSLPLLKVSAQADTVHHVYGLVVGISEYQDPFFTGLKYADDDAAMFANFLKTYLAKPADSGNIVLLTNQRANLYAFWKEMKKIFNKAKSGDTVYFFFSGHGDARSAKHVYLICHEGLKGQYESGGHININDLKDYIFELNKRGVRVVLITDACRSNEDNSKTGNIYFTEAMNQNTGELQFSSCKKNQNSYEDKRWGNGHGVFSWYLVKGWMGLADADGDSYLSFTELSKYVGDNVARDLYDNKIKRSLQTPYFYSPDMDAFVGNVDPDVRKRLLASEEAGENGVQEVLIPRYFAKGSKTSEIPDTVALAYYFKMNDAIQKEHFIEYDSQSAVFYYQRFKEHQKTGEVINDARLDLIAAMANKAQSYIQEVLQGNQTIASYEFRNAARLMVEAMAMMDTTDDMYVSMKARALFLEANSLMNDQWEMAIALGKLDSSLQLEPNKAYVYYDKAKIYEYYNVYFAQAEENYLTSIKLAPQWVRPVLDLGYMYISAGKYNQGTAYLNKAIAMQPGPYMYYLLGHTYQNLPDSTHRDSAVLYYNRALALDSNYVNALLGLAQIKQKALDYDSAKYYYLKAISLDSTYYYTYYLLGGWFYDSDMMEDARKYYQYVADVYPSYINAHWMLAQTYNYGLKEKWNAFYEYRACLDINYYYTKAYVAIGEILVDSARYNLAIDYLKIPWTFDRSYNPTELGRAYLARAMRDSSISDYDSATLWLDTANYYFPDQYFTQTLLGDCYYFRKDNNIPKSIAYYRASGMLNETYYYNWYRLGTIYNSLEKYDSAIYYYNLGMQLAPASYENYKALWSLYHYSKKDYKLASVTADSAIAHNIYPGYFYYLKSYSQWANGEFDAAMASVDSAISTYPGYASYLYTKAMVLSSLNRERDALEYLKKSMDAGLTANREDFFDGSFKNLEGNKKFNKLVKKYLKNKNNKN